MNSIDPRHPFLVETPVDVSGATVAILGCGSVGSFAALALASSGINHLHVADKDLLSEDNLRRHLCCRSDVGRAKTDSLQSALHGRFTNLDVTSHHFCFLDDPGRLRDLIAASDVVLVAIDQEGPKYLINDMLWQLHRPGVFAGVYGGGWGVELILVDPLSRTACYGCAANALGRRGIDPNADGGIPAYAMASDTSQDVTDNQRESASFRTNDLWQQATLTSIMPVASLAAQVVRVRLEAQRGNKQTLPEFRQGDVAAWRLALRQVPAWEAQPWTLQPVRVSPAAACPQQCGSQAA